MRGGSRRIRCAMVSAAMALATAVGGMEAAAQASDGGPLPTIELPSELDRVLRDYERGWQARDAEALTALVTACELGMKHACERHRRMYTK